MRIAIVDGYSVGADLATALRRGGAQLLHVASLPVQNDYFRRTFQRSDYEVDLGHEPDPDRLAGTLRGHGVQRIAAGTESGVMLADTLNGRLGLPGNAPDRTRARRDKGLMAEVVSAAGLAAPQGAVFTDPGGAVAWYTTVGLTEAVVKPPASAGSDNVWFCENAESVRRAASTVLGAHNLYGEPNGAVVVQRRLHGIEYYVNTVSHEGVHRVAEMWQYTKCRSAGGSPLYDYEQPIEASHPRAPALRTFVFAVLDALGVGTAAAHAEVMLTADGLVLIEVASRLGGATIPALVQKYAGVSQATLFAESLLDPHRLAGFDDRTDRWSATVRSVSLINHVAGTVRSESWLDRVLSLPTAAEVSAHLSVGEHVVRTTDLINSPGFVYLISDDPDAVRRDYDTLRAWERAGLYVT